MSLNPFLMSKPHGPKRVLQKVSNSSRSLLRSKFFCGTVYVITLKLKPDRRSACAALYVACVMDSANLMPVGVVAPSQLISLFGSGLAEASVKFDGSSATVLYASHSQWNPGSRGDVSSDSERAVAFHPPGI